MPFNATTYRMNRHRRDAWARLQEARDIRTRAAAGQAYDWELPRVATLVVLARNSMKLYRITRELRAIERGTP